MKTFLLNMMILISLIMLTQGSSFEALSSRGKHQENKSKGVKQTYETLMDVDNCIEVVCANGGNCISQENGYKCECTFGFVGEHCEKSSNDLSMVETDITSFENKWGPAIIFYSVVSLCLIFFCSAINKYIQYRFPKTIEIEDVLQLEYLSKEISLKKESSLVSDIHPTFIPLPAPISIYGDEEEISEMYENNSQFLQESNAQYDEKLRIEITFFPNESSSTVTKFDEEENTKNTGEMNICVLQDAMIRSILLEEENTDVMIESDSLHEGGEALENSFSD